MTPTPDLNTTLQIIASLLIFVAVYLSLLVLIVVGFILADLACDGARQVRDYTETCEAADVRAEYEVPLGSGWMDRARHIFQH